MILQRDSFERGGHVVCADSRGCESEEAAGEAAEQSLTQEQINEIAKRDDEEFERREMALERAE